MFRYVTSDSIKWYLSTLSVATLVHTFVFTSSHFAIYGGVSTSKKWSSG